MNEIPILTDQQFQEMTGIDIEKLVMSKLSDLATQALKHSKEGQTAYAELLLREGSFLAEYMDEQDELLFIDTSKL